jgi:hypothetical protein
MGHASFLHRLTGVNLLVRERTGINQSFRALQRLDFKSGLIG